MALKLTQNHNNFNLSVDDINAFVSFNIGKTNFYWEYKNGIPFCEKKEFTGEKLNQHLIGSKVFGFSPFVDNENVKFGATDFDAHRDEADTPEEYQKKVEVAQSHAKEFYEYLKSFNLPVILNSSGSDGRHVRLYCKSAPATNIRMYLKFVLYKLFKDPNCHEVFPKQDNLNDDRPYGNQIKGMLCVHPKHKKRANVIAGDKVLELHQSIKVMRLALENAGNIPPFSKKDYDMIKSLDKSHTYIEKYNNPGYVNTLQNVPDVCSFFEDVASKLPLPSKDKYARHTCLDSNMAAYGITHPQTRIAYAETQGRTSHTAFDNWSKYWKDNTPTFNCGQIIAYLRNHSKFGNKNALKGLNKCLLCSKFISFIEEKNKSKGWAKSISIIKFATKHNLLNCPVCNNAFKFEDRRGMYYCKSCKYGGGIKKFAKLILENKK